MQADASARWVTKSNIRGYRLCPYAFWLVDTGQVDLNSLLWSPEGAADLGRIEVGLRFEADVLSGMPTVPPGETPAGVRYLFNVGTFVHKELQLAGRPDGIDIEHYAPIEIKGHRRVTLMDSLELAFYWRLLEPHRTAQPGITPFGYVCLSSLNGEVDQSDLRRVELRPFHFAEVERLIAGVRDARERGIQPRYCECLVCMTRPEVVAIVTAGRDVRILWGVGPQRAKMLHDLGVATVEALRDADAVDIAARIKAWRLSGQSPAQVASWQHHARALTEERAVRFADGPTIGASYVVLDLEYDTWIPDGIWLVGALYHRPNAREEIYQRFCPGRPARVKAVEGLGEFLRRHRGVQIVTYAGSGADLPQLRAASGNRALAKNVARLHVDLFGAVAKSVRFPTRDHGLKSITDSLGFVRRSGISDGLEALAILSKWARSRSAKMREKHRRRLMAYNLEDLRATVMLVEFLRGLPTHPIAAEAHARACRRPTPDARGRRRRRIERLMAILDAEAQ
jgi:predicted RecB family nuclease